MASLFVAMGDISAINFGDVNVAAGKFEKAITLIINSGPFLK